MSRRGWLAPLAACVLYLAIGLPQLALPGLHYDEAFDALTALDALRGAPLDPHFAISVFGRAWPLMSLPHEGPTVIYLSMPAIALFGASPAVLRVLHLLVGCLTLVALWALTRRWAGARAAAVVVLLTATCPPFVWWSRSGGNWNDPLLPLALGVLLALDTFRRTRRTRALAAAALLFGLGVTTKILFLWLLAPIALAAWMHLGVAGLRLLWSPRAGVVAAAAGVAGLLPLIVLNRSGWPTLRFIVDNAIHTRMYGHDNLAIARNLHEQVFGFLAVMGGDTVVFDAPRGLPVGAALLVGALVYGAWRLWHERPAGLLVPWLAVVIVVPESTISPTHISPIYLFVLVPLAWMLVGWCLVDATSRRWPLGAPAGRRLLTAIVVLLLGQQLMANRAVRDHFAKTGGRGLWSDATYTLADRLDHQYAHRPVAAMDWGFARNVALLTGGRVRPVELFDYQPTPSDAVAARCLAWFERPDAVYLFHVPSGTAFKGVIDVFEQTAARAGRRVRVEDVLKERDGRPNTLIVTVRAESASEAPRREAAGGARPRSVP